MPVNVNDGIGFLSRSFANNRNSPDDTRELVRALVMGYGFFVVYRIARYLSAGFRVHTVRYGRDFLISLILLDSDRSEECVLQLDVLFLCKHIFSGRAVRYPRITPQKDGEV